MVSVGRLAVMTACLVCAACATLAGSARNDRETFANIVSHEGTVQLSGWASVHGEILIYATREAMSQRLRFPYCISAVFSNQYERDFTAFDGRRVAVAGSLRDYSRLPTEPGPRAEILPRKILDGAIVPNWCYGENVLLLNSIELE